ncbi:uncharacterized protein [Haliotis asinina]|uniref:uncharacterized protein isoform X1 n=1 Tax=Haliotis asinina TaxID=109174 RepID=UPI00353276FE
MTFTDWLRTLLLFAMYHASNIFYEPGWEGRSWTHYRVGGFSLSHLIAAFIVTAVFAFVVYLLWDCSCKRKEDQERQRLSPGSQRIDTKTMYALELEPGIVLLQSQDGEFFRILHEYDAVKHARDYGTAPPGGVALQGQTIHYIPNYTRAHMQTQASAPQPPEELMVWDGQTSPPPYQ